MAERRAGRELTRLSLERRVSERRAQGPITVPAPLVTHARSGALHLIGALRYSDLGVDGELGGVRRLDRELGLLQVEDAERREHHERATISSPTSRPL